MECPQKNNINSTLIRLQDVGALDAQQKLTLLGLNLAKLPVDIRVGKLILLGVIFSCLDSALTIAAFLSHNKNLFLSGQKIRDKVKEKKEKFGVIDSDQLTLLKMYKVIKTFRNKYMKLIYFYNNRHILLF